MIVGSRFVRIFGYDSLPPVVYPMWVRGVLVVGLLSFVLFTAQAQQSTLGRDFFVAFLPNYHNGGNLAPDSLSIFVVATETTNGTITYTDNLGQTLTRSFTISNPQQIFVHRVHFRAYELFGYNNSGTFVQPNENEQISPRVFRVTTDKDVAIYALNQALMTSDATLVLPVSSLGTEYFVMTYNSDGVLNLNGTLNNQYTPSQFVVVGVEDETDVTIYPTVPTTESGTIVKQVRLNRGQAYLVQAEYSRQNLNYDLTGTRIVASKNVAVFAGHQRALVPVTLRGTLISRDHLFEQMLPRSLLGTAYILTPLADPEGTPSGLPGSDLYRVLAVENGTEVKVNKQTVATLQRGQFYQSTLLQASLVESNKLVMVAVIKRTFSDDATLRLGDPFMMILPPRRQYLNRYRFQSCQAVHPQTGINTYLQQYITIVTTPSNVRSIVLDGAPLQAEFKPVQNTCYVYANVRVNDGVHTIESPHRFGLYVYGYGYADSYGYVGGMASVPDVPELEVNAGPDREICQGDNVTLSVIGNAASVKWSVASGYPNVRLPCDTCLTISIAPSATTKLILLAFDSLGCSISDEVLVTVHPKPHVRILPDTTVCSDSPVTIIADGSFQTIQWIPTTGLSCSVCPQTVVQPQPGSEIVYTAIVRNANSSSCEARDSVRVRFAPGIIGQLPTSITLCEGDSITLTLRYGGSVRWTPTNGISCPTCTSVTIRPQRTIRYTVVGDSSGCTTQAHVEVRVVPKPNLQPLSDTAICAGSSVQLALQVTGGQVEISPPLEVSCIGCLTPVFTPSQTRTYRIRAFAGTGTHQCSVEDSITITVNPRPTITVGGPLVLCAGDTTTVVVHVAGADEIEWEPPEGVGCRNCDSTIIIGTHSRSYSIVARTRQGCVNQATLSLIVHQRPTLHVSPIDTIVCAGETVLLNAQSDGDRLEWEHTAPLSCYDCAMPTYVASQPRTITVRSFNKAGCSTTASIHVDIYPAPTIELPHSVNVCIGKNVHLQVYNTQPTYQYRWSPAEGLSCADCPDPIASPAFTTRYILTTTSVDGCIDRDTVVVNVVPCRRAIRAHLVRINNPSLSCDTSIIVLSIVNPPEESDQGVEVHSINVIGLAGEFLGLEQQTHVATGPNAGARVELPRIIEVGEQWEVRCRVILVTREGAVNIAIASSLGDTTISIHLRSQPQVITVKVLPVLQKEEYSLPGETVTYRVEAYAIKWDILNIRSMVFRLSYPLGQLSYAGTFTRALRDDLDAGQWLFSLQERVSGTNAILSIVGSGIGSLIQNGALLSFPMHTFLGSSYFLHPKLEVEIFPSEILPCVSLDVHVEPVVLEVCGGLLRRVSISSFGFGIRSVTPNPAERIVSIDYDVGLPAWVRLELVNAFGQRTDVLVDTQLKSGHYRLDFPTEHLAPGIYWCRYQAGDIINVVPLIIVR